MKKRIISLLLVLFAFFAFVGCNNKNTNSSGNNGEENMSNVIFPSKTEMKTDGQLYTGNAVEFPSSLWETPASERYEELDRDGLGVYG